jgi:hypothetical protein
MFYEFYISLQRIEPYPFISSNRVLDNPNYQPVLAEVRVGRFVAGS